LPISDRKTIIKSSAYTQNKIYIQNLSSIFAAQNLNILNSDWVLDLAAAPGGKSLIFSERAKKVSAVEPNKSRFFRMKRNFKEHGAKNIMSFNKDGRFVYKATGAIFDKVFLDAPCSSEAHIDLKKGITWWNLRRVNKFSKLQKELIISAFEALKIGGEMIYATCTFAPEENEEVVDFLLKKYSNAKVDKIEHSLKNAKSGLLEFEGKKYDNQVSNALRIIPKDAFSGFFLAKIIKT
jgi:16S rRNA C967 or C1407 C5-methylase (RsmB/RsmF family)